MMAHPDFIHAPETRRFQGASLVSLWATLKRELEGKAAGGQVYRILPSGACVALWRKGAERAPGTPAVAPRALHHAGRAREVAAGDRHLLQALRHRRLGPGFSAPGVAVLLYEPAVLL
jgi:hypothetical protein